MTSCISALPTVLAAIAILAGFDAVHGVRHEIFERIGKRAANFLCRALIALCQGRRVGLAIDKALETFMTMAVSPIPSILFQDLDCFKQHGARGFR